MKWYQHLLLLIILFFQIHLLYNVKGNESYLSVLLFAVQILFVCMLYFFKNKASQLLPSISNNSKYLLIIPFCCLLFLLGARLNNKIKEVPVGKCGSDVILQVDTLCIRFLNNQMPYKTIDFGYELQPTYMPLQWLPYCIAIKFNIDERLFAYTLFSVSFLLLLFITIKSSLHQSQLLFSILGFLVLLYPINCIVDLKYIITATLEQGIVAFYILIPICIGLKKYTWATLAIAICLLSRYSIVFWVPLYLLVLFTNNKKMALVHASIIFTAVMVLYVIPFLSKDTSIFIRGYQYHSFAALGEWKHLNENKQPTHLFDGQGLAFLFYNLKTFSLQAKLVLLQKFHLLICTLLISAMSLYYLKIKNSINKELFLIISLALYLLIFYSFIQIPYKYLFLLPVCNLVACYIAILQLHNKKVL